MSPDVFAVHHRQRAKRTAQTPCEYAAAIERFRRPTNWRTRVLIALAVVLLLAAAAALEGM